jgi:hypothetical protein
MPHRKPSAASRARRRPLAHSTPAPAPAASVIPARNDTTSKPAGMPG